MAKGLARPFGQDLMRGEHGVGGDKTNSGVLMSSHSSGDPSFYAKKRAKKAELGRDMSTEEILADHYQPSEASTASGTSIFDPVLCEIAYRWFCPPGGTVLDPFAGGSVRGVVASRLGLSYRTSRTPYMRGTMDALSPRNLVQRVVFMKAAQVGATEAGNNWVGFCIHRAPGSILAAQPTTDLAKRLSQQRIDPLIVESPDLRALITPNRSRNAGSAILGKRFPGGQLILTGPNLAVGLR